MVWVSVSSSCHNFKIGMTHSQLVEGFSATMRQGNLNRWYESARYSSLKYPQHESSSAGCRKSDFGNDKNHKHLQNYFYINPFGLVWYVESLERPISWLTNVQSQPTSVRWNVRHVLLDIENSSRFNVCFVNTFGLISLNF